MIFYRVDVYKARAKSLFWLYSRILQIDADSYIISLSLLNKSKLSGYKQKEKNNIKLSYSGVGQLGLCLA